MLRRIFLSQALDRLVEEGIFTRRSNAFRVMRIVIDDGVAGLNDAQREFYDLELIPQIEKMHIRMN